MNNIPNISVVMSIYNEPVDWLRASINSILTQTFYDYEFIIINDNPRRSVNEKILNEYKYRDRRIVLILNDVNIGLTKSLNKGLSIAKGKYIARMDADDISLRRRFQIQYDFMEKNENIGVCGSYVKQIGSNRKKVIKYPLTSHNIKYSLLYDNQLAHPSVFIRRDIIKKNNIRYNEKYIYAQDYKLWADLYDVCDFSNIPSILLLYRIRDSQVSHIKKTEQKELSNEIKKELLFKILKQNKVNIIIANNHVKQIRYIEKSNIKPVSKAYIYISLYFINKNVPVKYVIYIISKYYKYISYNAFKYIVTQIIQIFKLWFKI